MKLLPGLLYIDVHEPIEVYSTLLPIIPIVKLPINEMGKADYYWINLADKEVMYERKQLLEALHDLDGLEEQLYRHLGNCDELNLVVENPGIATEVGVQAYTYMESQKRFRATRLIYSQGLWQRWEGLKWSLIRKCGIQVVETSCLQQTIQHLLASYRQSLEPVHTTLQRYTIEHIPQWSKNPHIDNLMRLKGVRIGEVNATKLIERFHTVYGVISADYNEMILTMGVNFTKQFFKGIGREHE